MLAVTILGMAIRKKIVFVVSCRVSSKKYS